MVSSFTSRLTWTAVTLKLPYWIQYGFKLLGKFLLHLHFLIDTIDTLKPALCTDHSFHMLQPLQCLYSLTKANKEWHSVALWEYFYLIHWILCYGENLENKRFSFNLKLVLLSHSSKMALFCCSSCIYLEVTLGW